MKLALRLGLAFTLALPAFFYVQSARAQGTAFTYQGQLQNNGLPASGTYNLQFTLYNNGAGSGSPLAGPITTSGVLVTNGLFTVTIDFGSGPWNGRSNWLEIAVETIQAATFTALSPLQQLTPAPYAIFAESTSNLTTALPASQLSGQIGNANLPASPTFSGTVTAGGFSGNGNNLTTLNPANLSAGTAAINISGNAATASSYGGTLAISQLTPPGAVVTNGNGSIFLGGVAMLSTNASESVYAGPGAGNVTSANESDNVAFGYKALGSGNSGLVELNVAVGCLAMLDDTSGADDVAVGAQALEATPSGSEDTAVGAASMFENAGSYDTAIGYNALFRGGGSENTASGAEALYSDSGTGNDNTADGFSALDSNTTGSNNVAVGYNALFSNIAGNNNVALGPRALYFVGTSIASQGTNNIAIGFQAGENLTSGSSDIYIGSLGGAANENNTIRIGTPGIQTVTYIAGTLTGDGGGLTNLNAVSGVALGAGLSNSIAGGVSDAFVGGGVGNTISNGANYAFIGSGDGNTIEMNSLDSVIGGGLNNTNLAGAAFSVVGGGLNNVAGQVSTVSGGQGNTADNFATVGGGYENTASGDIATVGGGDNNTAGGTYATVGGGYENYSDNSATVGGGEYNTAGGGSATVGGGYENASGDKATVGGGSYNNASGPDSTVGGGQYNIASGNGSFIGGGGYDGSTYSGNTNAGNAAAIVGGFGNQIQSGGDYSFIGSGDGNTIEINSLDSVIGGGLNNTNLAGAGYSVISGGELNQVASGWSVICGGSDNTISSGMSDDFIGGGLYNTNSGQAATVGGGQANTASAAQATVGGGYFNTASGDAATVSGGQNNIAGGICSFAAGRGAQAITDNTFVWSDGSYQFSSTTNKQFLILASHGVGINTASPAKDLSVNGGMNVDQAGLDPGVISSNALTFGTGSSGEGIASDRINNGTQYDLEFYTAFANRIEVLNNGNVGIGNSNPNYLLVVGAGAYSDGNAWYPASDRNIKRDFAAINSGEVLQKVAALPITEWQYKSASNGIKHLGPMAQDFHAAFGLNGTDDKHIADVDEGGVALAAIQGLNQKLDEKSQKAQDRIQASEDRIQSLETQNTKLQAQLTDLQAQLAGLQKAVATLTGKSTAAFAANAQPQEQK